MNEKVTGMSEQFALNRETELRGDTD